MNYQQKIPSTTKGLKWVHPGDCLYQRSGICWWPFQTKSMYAKDFSMNCFYKWRTWRSVSSVSLSLPDRLTSILLLPHQHEAPGSEVDFFFWNNRGLGKFTELCFGKLWNFQQLLSISKSWPQKVKTLEWPVGPHYNWFDTFMWRSSKRQQNMAHL